MTHGGGGGVRKVPKIVNYYLNGPLELSENGESENAMNKYNIFIIFPHLDATNVSNKIFSLMDYPYKSSFVYKWYQITT